MSVKSQKKAQIPPTSSVDVGGWKKVGNAAYDADWNPLPVQNKNGWWCVRITGGYVPLKAIEDYQGHCWPVYLGVVLYGAAENEWTSLALKMARGN